MSYLDEVQQEFKQLLDKQPKLDDVAMPDDKQEYEQAMEELAELQVQWENEVCQFVRNKLLQSYKNGAETARNQMNKRRPNKDQKPKQKSKTQK